MEGRLVGGRYRLDRRIGSGAMGVVWQAYDERLRRAVAVKQLRLDAGLSDEEADEARQRAMREGRIAARLHHPNAVAVFDVVDEDDAPWLVMEYLPSRSLAAEMTEGGVLRPEEVGRIGAQVAHALAAAHAAGIVHRDIKPANVLLGDSGTVKITDFGISRATGDVAVTKTGLIAGTPAYLAPEVAYGRNPEASSDVFSLGSTLYAAVEGMPPFGLSENTLGLLHAVAAGRINPPQRSGILTDTLIALLDADPERRPNAATAAQWLDTVARGTRPNIAPIGSGPTAVLGGTATTIAMPGPTARTAPARTALAPGGYAPDERTTADDYDDYPVAPAGRARGGVNRRALAIGGLVLAAVVIVFVVLLLSNAFSGDGGGGSPGTGGGGDSTQQSNPVLPAPSFSDITQTTTEPTHYRTTEPQQTATTVPTTTTQQTTTTTETTTTTTQVTTTTVAPPTTTDGNP